MPKAVKIILILLTALLAVAALVAVVVGLTSGWENLTGKQQVETREYTCDATGVTLLQLNLSNRAIKVTAGDQEQIVIRYPATQIEGLRVQGGDNQLVVEESYSGNWMQWAFAFLRGRYDRTVEIQLPKTLRAAVRMETTYGDLEWSGSCSMVSLYLHTTYGDVTLAGASSGQDVTLSTDLGDVTAESVRGSALRVEAYQGEVTLLDITGSTLDVQTVNAPIQCENLSVRGDLTLSTTHASISAWKLEGKAMTLSTTDQAIEGSLFGREREYTIHATTTGGISTLPVEQVVEEAQRSLTVRTNDADIRLSFLEDIEP